MEVIFSFSRTLPWQNRPGIRYCTTGRCLLEADNCSLKVFPPGQRTQGIFNEQDMRLKSLIKDMDCSDLAVREAWESFVSVSRHFAAMRSGAECGVRWRRMRKVPHTLCGHCHAAVGTASEPVDQTGDRPMTMLCRR